MKKLIVFLIMMGFLMTGSTLSYASNWDVAGKVLTGIEGLRILTGGRVDAVGTLIGAGKASSHGEYKHKRRHKKHHRYVKHSSHCAQRVWVPHFEWHKKYIPAHEEYDEHLGTIIVEDHYIKYKIESGGHWTTVNSCS